jgi:hypothetical protein
VSRAPDPAPSSVVGWPAETLLVWTALGLATLAVLVTYARLPPEELYNVSGEGVGAGLGRALVFLNYPVALAAVPVALLAAALLRNRLATAAALLVAGSAALVPFVVDQGDLDARPANALPAAGVAVALLLTAAAARRSRAGAVRTRLPADRLRIVVAALLVVVAVPWMFAELGFYAPDPILADERPPGERLAAVHLGNHHGSNGVLLALAALALSRVPPRLPRSPLTVASSALLALMLAYGVANAVQDAWLEQVVKRGTTAYEIPRVTKPGLTAAWAVVLVSAVLIELLWFRRERRAPTTPTAGRQAAAEPG